MWAWAMSVSYTHLDVYKRHVDIRRLGDIRFDTQLERALRPSPDYDVSQWLFVPNQYTCLLYTSRCV